MNHKEKMTRHLLRAEELNAEVDALEAQALKELGLLTVYDRISAYKMTDHMKHNDLYRQRGNARNLQLQFALAHGIAALVEITQDDVSRGDHV